MSESEITALETELRVSSEHSADLYLDLEEKTDQIEALEWKLEAERAAVAEAREVACLAIGWWEVWVKSDPRGPDYASDSEVIRDLRAKHPWLNEQVTPDQARNPSQGVTASPSDRPHS